ncbi:hypothetical protein [Chitinimonas sp. BJB300]|uniref:hypothetical protein n=1 Tax=Chitinimonas sp. BJB300 TaxID=1559339 RepID=UPI001111E368|nr:hypothetical protein [Chitinimonas sp. BJB300]
MGKWLSSQSGLAMPSGMPPAIEWQLGSIDKRLLGKIREAPAHQDRRTLCVGMTVWKFSHGKMAGSTNHAGDTQLDPPVDGM